MASWLYDEQQEDARKSIMDSRAHTHHLHSQSEIACGAENEMAEHGAAKSEMTGTFAAGASEDRKNLVEIRNLSKDFKLGRKNIVRALSDVSFDIKYGEVFALVGESGSGKSTLARCILGLYEPSSGSISISSKTSGAKMEKAGAAHAGRNMQFISQDSAAALNQKMTVRDIITEPFEINKVYKEKSELDDRIAELLDEVGVDRSLMYRYPPEISGGQRQRVSIARAYGMEPELLVADEPLAALDVSVQAQIVELFASLMKQRKMSMLFIAHDLSMVEFLSQRVGVMYRGRMVEMAETKELFSDPVHPYTKALLSAVPVPDPSYEKGRIVSKYIQDEDALAGGIWTQVSAGHFVLMSEKEGREFNV